MSHTTEIAARDHVINTLNLVSKERTRVLAKALAEDLRRIWPLTQSAALETVACAMGFRDWNTASALLPSGRWPETGRLTAAALDFSSYFPDGTMRVLPPSLRQAAMAEVLRAIDSGEWTAPVAKENYTEIQTNRGYFPVRGYSKIALLPSNVPEGA